MVRDPQVCVRSSELSKSGGAKWRGTLAPGWLFLTTLVCLMTSVLLTGQVVSVSLQGRVYDSTGAAVPDATVTAVDSATGLTRTNKAGAMGDYQIQSLPPGDYTVTVEKAGFRKVAKKVHLDLGASGALDFSLPVGEIKEEVTVQDVGEVAEPTRTMVSSVIDEQKIDDLPVNGRQFIDFALLAPGVTVGDTTSGSTDVIIEPVTKLSFAGQNIHYNFVAIDGADNMSTASGIQKTTPSQEAVQEFRVVNSSYGTEFGRAVGGIVNIITKSGTNSLHGSVYEYFRNDKMDAENKLAAAGGFNKLRQNQFGATLGGPIVKDKTFYFANYEGQRHSESPYYNQTVLDNITAINQVKTQVFGLPAENLFVNRTINYDNFTGKIDHRFSTNEALFVRYFLNDQRSTNLSPLNDGFDLPSGFKNNNFRDQSIVGNLSSLFSNSLVNELRVQYAHRFFDFPTVSTQPHLEVSNVFTMGVNRGNPDFYEEGRAEIADTVTKTWGKHTLSFGGDFNHVNTTESFPLFYPFEADFGSLSAFLGDQNDFVSQIVGRPTPHPFVIFFERFDTASGFNEPTFSTSVYQGSAISSAVRNQAKGELGHTYEGLFIQDKWRATSNLTLDYGLRWQGETWPSAALNNPLKNFDPRAGFSYAIGGSRNVVIRGGAGLFHGMIPSPLLMCQIPSCGGLQKYPGRENIQDDLNAKTRLSAFGSDPFTMAADLAALTSPGLTTATYPVGSLDAVIVRFVKNHKQPYGAQASVGVEFQPFKNAVLDITGMHVRGIHLGSFYNVNQPDANPFYTTGAEAAAHVSHTSTGQPGFKNYYCGNPGPTNPTDCLPGTLFGVLPNIRTFPFAVDFEADSKWDSQWDGLLVDFNKRMSNHIAFGLSYTWSKGIDNGPNPSFVLIPQDTCCFGRERAVSSDSVKHRFVGNATLAGPTHLNPIINNWQLSTIVSLESPHYFTKFAGFDSNGDIFGNNDRVGIEPRNTFKGDSYQTVDMRVSRTFAITEKTHLEAMAEAFNLLNTLNIHFYNTAYGAADFCPFATNPTAVGCPATPSGFREGSPNPSYGTPRSIFNPRQVQLALRLTW